MFDSPDPRQVAGMTAFLAEYLSNGFDTGDDEDNVLIAFTSNEAALMTCALGIVLCSPQMKMLVGKDVNALAEKIANCISEQKLGISFDEFREQEGA
jgi:hypothetical protein